MVKRITIKALMAMTPVRNIFKDNGALVSACFLSIKRNILSLMLLANIINTCANNVPIAYWVMLVFMSNSLNLPNFNILYIVNVLIVSFYTIDRFCIFFII